METDNKEVSPRRGRPPKKEKNILTDSSSTLLMQENKSSSKSKGEAVKIKIGDIQRDLSDLFKSALEKFSATTGDFQSFNPFLQNNRLKLINILPQELSGEALYAALQEPQNHEFELRGASWSLSATQYLYYKIIREAADIPLFKYYFTPPLLEDKRGYNKPEFKQELSFVESWAYTLGIAPTFKRIALDVKREGKSTYVFRQSIEEGREKKINYVSFQKLPSAYTKLTAIGELGYIASFNLLIFLNPAFLPSQYPDYIQEIWEDLTKNKIVYVNPKTKQFSCDYSRLAGYSFANRNGDTIRGIIEKNSDTYMYWVQLPQDLCFTFASDTSHPWAVPDTMGLFTALQELTDYSVLAGMITSSPLTAVLTGEAEACPNAQPGQDQTVLSPHTMLAFQNAFDEMVSGNIQGFFAPFKDLKLQSLPDIPNASNIKTSAVQNFISVAGEGGIIAATDKPSVAMIKGAQLLAAAQADFVTRQFEAVLNKVLNTWCGLDNFWKIHIWGDIYSFENTVSSLKEQVLMGATYLIPKLASAHDYHLIDIQATESYLETTGICRQLAKENTEKIEEKNPVGRPPADENNIENENTAASIDAGTNTAEGRSYSAPQCLICGALIQSDEYLCPECLSKISQKEAL